MKECVEKSAQYELVFIVNIMLLKVPLCYWMLQLAHIYQKRCVISILSFTIKLIDLFLYKILAYMNITKGGIKIVDFYLDE